MVEVLQAKHIRDIACGSNHSAAITSNGELYTWGSGEDGCLGHGDTANQLRPKQVGKIPYSVVLFLSYFRLLDYRTIVLLVWLVAVEMFTCWQLRMMAQYGHGVMANMGN